MLDGTVGTYPPCLSVSHPVAQEIVEAIETGTQSPSPLLVYPDGQTDERGDELGTQFPFPSLWNPDAQNRGTESAMQFPFPSLVNPIKQTATDGAGVMLFFFVKESFWKKSKFLAFQNCLVPRQIWFQAIRNGLSLFLWLVTESV